MYQEPGRVTSPSPSPKIRRGDSKSLCANVFVRSNRNIIFALGLGHPRLRQESLSCLIQTHRPSVRLLLSYWGRAVIYDQSPIFATGGF